MSIERFFTVPFSRDDLFVGHEDAIADISKKQTASQVYTRVGLIELTDIS